MSPYRPRSRRLGWIHKIWLVALVIVQLSFVILMPVFTGNDERTHNDRMWALVDGHFFCATLPQAVRDVEAMRGGHGQFAAYWRKGVTFAGSAERVDGASYGCYYFPVALVAPALVTRVIALDWHGVPRRGGVFIATYVARVLSLAIVDAGLFVLLLAAPWGRSTALALFSNPMMIEQSISIGHDNLLFCLTLLILAIYFTRNDWRSVGWIALFATIMTLIKPVFVLFGLLALPMIARLAPSVKAMTWKHRLLAVSWLAPVPAYVLWSRLGAVSRRMWMPSFVHPRQQFSFLLHHPLHVFTVMIGYVHYFIDDHTLVDFYPHRINGEWTTLFFANLWLQMPKLGCVAAALGIVVAVVADVTSQPSPPDVAPSSRRERVARLLAILGVASAIPATILALYVTYTPVGHAGPYAVQGRYHACALVALALLAVYGIKRRAAKAWRGALAASLVGWALMLTAEGYALSTIWRYYWA